MGYESNDASILTNVSSDHLDLQGIHTLPELAEVKATVCRITKPDGWVVLNGDDPLVAAVARRVRANVAFFSMDRNGEGPPARAPPRRERRPRLPPARRLAHRGDPATSSTRIAEVGPDPDHDRRPRPAQRRERARGGRRRARPGRDDRAGARRPARLPAVDRPLARAAQPVPARVAAGHRRLRPQRGRDLGGARCRRGHRRPAARAGPRRSRRSSAPPATGPTTRCAASAGSPPSGPSGSSIKETRQVPARPDRRRRWSASCWPASRPAAGSRPTSRSTRARRRPCGRSSTAAGRDAPRVIVLMCHEERDEVFALLEELGARPVDVADELTTLVPRLQDRPRRD